LILRRNDLEARVSSTSILIGRTTNTLKPGQKFCLNVIHLQMILSHTLFLEKFIWNQEGCNWLLNPVSWVKFTADPHKKIFRWNARKNDK
jgi:hypothetical protein